MHFLWKHSDQNEKNNMRSDAYNFDFICPPFFSDSKIIHRLSSDKKRVEREVNNFLWKEMSCKKDAKQKIPFKPSKICHSN